MWKTVMTLTLLAAGCGNVGSDAAICTGSAQAVAAHAAALAADGGDRSVVSGNYLIRLIDAGCGR